MSFGDGLAAELRRQSASAGFEWRALERLTLAFAAGAAVHGDLTLAGDGRRFSIDPGPVGSFGLGYRILDGEGFEPFVLLGGTFAATTARTLRHDDEARLTALDLRASVTLGKVFVETLAPYLALRGFGGPIFWEIDGVDRVGSDRLHFQVGAGLIVNTGVIDAFFEAAPLGERSLSTGLALSF